MDTKKIIKFQYITTAIVGVSIISSIFVYIIIAEVIKFKNSPFHGFSSFPINPVLHYGIIGAGIIPIIILNYLKDSFLNDMPKDIYSGLNKLKTIAIISIALCEIPAVLGLLLFLLWGISFDFYILIGISLISEYKYFPRLSQWEEFIKQYS